MTSMTTGEHKVFCGGTFCFDHRDKDYERAAAHDYRAELLGSVEALLRPRDGGVRISPCVVYVGPFYFETETMDAEAIIKCEKEMIDSCTDAIFILDNASCPGTIAEVMYANTLGKDLHLFFIQHSEEEETESSLHTPCWYPILFCKITNDNARLYPCISEKDAKKKVLEWASSLLSPQEME